jgi:hypothetical protein
VSEYKPAGDIPIDEAVHKIIAAPNRHIASRIRNDVAYAAMKLLRPGDDAEIANEAYFDRWGDELSNQATNVTPPASDYWGD